MTDEFRKAAREYAGDGYKFAPHEQDILNAFVAGAEYGRGNNRELRVDVEGFTGQLVTPGGIYTAQWDDMAKCLFFFSPEGHGLLINPVANNAIAIRTIEDEDD